MAIPLPESAAARPRDDVRVPLAHRRSILLLALALSEVAVLAILFGVTLATEAEASDSFGHAHAQVMLMVSLVAVPGAIVRLVALLLARAALFSSLLTSAVCARAVWIVLSGVVLSGIGQVICLFNASAFVPDGLRFSEGERLVVSVMWSSVLVITWAVAMGVSQTAVIRSAWVAAVKALNRGHAGAVKHSLTEP
jgi:hypothetical protein